MKVCAVVVTFNRKEMLALTLAALENQTRPLDKILVINNASTDDTQDYLDHRKFTRPASILHLTTNTGGAGGFSSGIERAYQEDFDAIWLMDDDTVPTDTALAELLKPMEEFAINNGGNYPSFACSMVRWKDGSLCEMNTPTTTWDWPRWMVQGADWQLARSCSFVSCLVTKEAVAAVGFPYREYFIWADDMEYTLRLSKWRPGVFAPKSICDHLLAENRGVNWGDVNKDNIWKFKYGARNQVSAAISLRSLGILADLAQNMITQLRHSSVPWKLRLILVKQICKGFVFRPRKRFPSEAEK